MKRKIVEINEKRCDGCGLCVEACHEGAIEIINGKAKLVKDEYCDGLGDCLPACPQDAIEIIEREAKPFDEEAVKERMADLGKTPPESFGCPGAAQINKAKNDKKNLEEKKKESSANIELESELNQWPIQLKLVNPYADYFAGANVLIAADCVAYAYAAMHQDFIKDHITLIGCPKLDDINEYLEKVTEIFKENEIQSITVLRMEVPCCAGIVNMTSRAYEESGLQIPYRQVTIGIEGNIISDEKGGK
ncbi:ATP-binding protein [Natranaerofaba carboxydovora]|uniref:ATP-binding protein n=1 Tax=Natranaerofaba carboxydovora TaxID=2742683 RepID=UPI001F12D3C5|nr:4Fe-4S binding protein [Natranaerofaba carboxydovora]UMZ72895.1 4Fe-4S binding domain protein [Natranaerofaba carboxydovora]